MSAQAPRVPPNEPLNIPWPKKYHLASSKRLGLCAIKIRLLSLQFFSFNFLETSLSLASFFQDKGKKPKGLDATLGF